MFVGLSACLSVFFLSATRHLSTLRRCLRVLREQQEPSSRAAPRAARASACTCESTRAHAVQLLYEKIAALMPFKNKTVRARILSYTLLPRFSKRKPTYHFPSSVYSLPSLGVFTFRIVLNRILHKSSLLAPMHGVTENQATYLHCGGEARAKKRARPPATCRKSVAVSLPEIFRGVNLLAD